MTRTHRLLLAIVAVLTLSGCSSYKVVKSDFVAPASASGAAPLPLIAGLKVSGQTLTGGFSEI